MRAPPSPAPRATWDGATLRIDDTRRATAQLIGLGAFEPLALEVAFEGIQGTVMLGDKRIVASGKRVRLRRPLPAQAEFKIADVTRGEVAIGGAPLMIELAGYEPLTAELPALDPRPALAKVFAEIVERHVRFPEEMEATGFDLAAVVDASGIEWLGTGETLHDLDWIAVVGAHAKCDGQRVRIYDRWTSRLVTETCQPVKPGAALAWVKREFEQRRRAGA